MFHHFSYTKRTPPPPTINGNRSAPGFTHVYIGGTLAKVMEDLFCKRFLPQLEGKVDKHQFARKGMSTTDALISFHQPIFEAIDKGDNIARIFFTDFSKGFDRVDHNVLMIDKPSKT